jgi:hypothetical protein
MFTQGGGAAHANRPHVGRSVGYAGCAFGGAEGEMVARPAGGV